MKTNSVLIFFTFFLLVVPSVSDASVRITEIMYDLEGADTGHEWVEVANDGDSAVDIASFRLFEGGTNHYLTSVQGGGVLAPGAAAVIADDAAKFVLDWPAYAGLLFDTSFSGGLSNSGELLTLRNGDLVDVDTVTYSSSSGAAGDGNSLSRSGSSFVSAAPSPGSYGSGSSPGGSSPPQSDATSSTPIVTASAIVAPPPKTISIYAGDSRVALVGVDAIYSAEVFGTNGEKAANARVVWNFGDGTSKEGISVLHAYAYPGKYSVFATGALNEYSAGTRFTVTALPAQVTLRVETDGTLSVLNTGGRDIDLSRWIIARGGFEFRFPEGTFVLAGEGVHLPPTTRIPSEGRAELLYPNGTPAGMEVPALEPIEARPAPVVRGASTISRQESSGIVPTAAPEAPPPEPASAEAEEGGAPTEERSQALLWLVAALALGALGAAAVIFVRQNRGDASQSVEDIASTYEIIE